MGKLFGHIDKALPNSGLSGGQMLARQLTKGGLAAIGGGLQGAQGQQGQGQSQMVEQPQYQQPDIDHDPQKSIDQIAALLLKRKKPIPSPNVGDDLTYNS
jgi:hypothetical protein